MIVVMFQRRFELAIRAGIKFSTIRPFRKHPVQVGDLLSLRVWTGLPYRTPQREIIQAVCIGSREIRIDFDGFTLNNHFLATTERTQLARIEGFANRQELKRWFIDNHGFPFVGNQILWTPYR